MIGTTATVFLTALRGLASVLLQEALFSLLVAAVVWAVLRVWQGAPAHMRMALWSLVLVRLVLPVSWAHPLSLRSAIDRIAAGVRAGGEVGGGREALESIAPAAAAYAPAAANHGAAAAAWTLAGAAWLTGALLVAVVSLRRRLAFRRSVAGGRWLGDARGLALLDDWRRRLGVRREVRLVAVAGSPPPFTLGVLRPVIALPETLLASDDAAALELVIAHEMAHVRRLDDLWLALQRVLQVVYFFDPAVWLAVRRLYLARERLCDGMVLAEGTITAAAYGRGLLAVHRHCRQAADATVLALGDPARHWRERLASLREAARAGRWQRLAAAGTAAALAAVLLPMGPVATAATEPAVPASRIGTAMSSLSEPVSPAVRFIFPVAGARVTSGFGPRRRPVTGEPEVHGGVDLAVRAGTPVVAAAAGVVSSVTSRAGTADGAAVTIAHGERLATFYAYVEGVVVANGQAVRAGERIGTAGTAPGSTGPHLHFEVHEDGTPVDPARLLP